ncbi:hypothetical protein [Leucothrix arctica]|uniref:Uncharacterized protein n=1 Tax=Leucothrix arctica TaxID=1481894 RepID=A0A317CGD4_9GAMM|nr:hypothetical protein [Leucothrix arctica]PWQ97588.1 hypothetical protein DKT75_06625 [Leucothrix arctica]
MSHTNTDKKINNIALRCSLTLLVGLTLAVSALAADSGTRPERPKGPPAEAFTACESLSVGDACAMTTPRGEMTGSCKAAPNGEEGPLACAPAGGRGQRGERPS